MRVTNNMMSNMMLHNLNRNMYSMSKLQEQGSDGKRIHRPSDDAIGISKILKFKSDLSELNQYESNIKDVLSWYQVSESAIVDISSAVDRMRELAVQASNSATQTPDDLKKIKAEVEQLKSHIVSAGNFSYAGKYVFSGYQNDKPLLKTEIVNGKEVVSYNVDVTDRDVARPQKMRYAVGEAEQIQVTTSGLEIFGIEDLNVNKNVYAKMYTDSSGTDFAEGITAIQTRFDRTKDYTTPANQMNIKFTDSNGVESEYDVDESLLNGTETPLDKSLILSRYKNASNGSAKLADVADVYFDEHDNLVIKTKHKGESVAPSTTNDNIKFASTKMGLSAKKSELVGKFAIDGPKSDYRNSTIVYNVDGKNFTVDTSQLTGKGFTLKRDKVLEEIRNAEDGLGDKLSNHADVFFNQNGNLVVKHKEYGEKPISVTIGGTNSGGYTALDGSANIEVKKGNDVSEAEVNFSPFTFDDDYIKNHEDELKNNALFITYNGERKEISLDRNAVVDTADKYKNALQASIDKTFGDGKIEVKLNSGSLTFKTKNTPDGINPEIRVEPVVTKKSSLLGEIDHFIEALGSSDHEAINNFLGNIDGHLNRILAVRSDIGAKTNRMELALERTKDNVLTFTKSLSKVEDVDLAETIMKLKNYENVYRASLSMGSKIIQPSLVDFIR